MLTFQNVGLSCGQCEESIGLSSFVSSRYLIIVTSAYSLKVLSTQLPPFLFLLCSFFLFCSSFLISTISFCSPQLCPRGLSFCNCPASENVDKLTNCTVSHVFLTSHYTGCPASCPATHFFLTSVLRAVVCGYSKCGLQVS